MWEVYGERLNSRLFIGSAQFSSPEILRRAIQSSGASVVTVSLARQTPASGGGQDFWDIIKGCNCRILPNTAGCRSVEEAVLMAQMAREVFETKWIKLEIIGDDYTLHPDIISLCEASKELVNQGFEVFPYCTDDLTACRRLIECGCRVIMPGVAPIGSGQGVLNSQSLRLLRDRYNTVSIIVDAGIGRPSDAAMIMEMGIDGVLINSAIARALDPPSMARAFKYAVECGYTGYKSGIINKRDLAVASTNLVDTPFWHRRNIT